jgi:Immunity protein 35
MEPVSGAAVMLVCFLWSSPAATNGTPSPSPAASPAAAGITKERAVEIARAKLVETKPAAGFAIVESRTVERPFGWVFFYEAGSAPKAGDPAAPAAAIPGAGPLVVLRAGGGTAFLSTSVPPDKAIAEYEKTWLRRATRKPPS